jgi:serine/threonine-protein kinase
MRKLVKISIYIAAIFVVGMLSGYVTFKLMSFSRTVNVPDLIGKGMVDADNILRSKGLYIRLEGEDYDSYIPEGHVMRQDIPAGNSVKEGREIRVVLSKGPRMRYIPDIVGQPLDIAESLLKEKGIKIDKVIYVHSGQIERNIIIAQRPETTEKGADKFSVIVSLGSYEQSEEDR